MMDKVKDDKKQQKTGSLLHRLTGLLLSLALGYFGGWLAVRNSQVTDLSKLDAPQVVLQESEVIADVAERVSPSVVSINVLSSVSSRSIFFGTSEYESASEGTGIIINSDGLVVTNKHVIPENSTEVEVTLSDGTTYDEVEVLGRDPFNDIAFLKIKNGKDLVPATLGDSSKIRVGDKVIAIGNALGRFDTTVTSGIISGLGRPIVAGDGFEAEQLQNLFQTDTAINPGNSGGPLVNINGEVIGINTAVAGDGENIGFAIPINDVVPGIKSVEKNGELIRPYLGVRYVAINNELASDLDLPVNRGALVTADVGQIAILKDSPADKAGLQREDIITHINDKELNETNPLVTAVSQFAVGETIILTVLRDGDTIQVPLELEAVPDDL